MLSIQKRLNYTYGIVIIASFVLLGSLLLLPLENYFLSQAKENLILQVRLASQLVKPYIFNKDYQKLRAVVTNVGQENNFRITVVLADGKVVADNQHDYLTMENHLSRPEIINAQKKEVGYSIRLSDTLKKDLLYCAYAIRHQGQIIGYIRIAVSLEHIDEVYGYIRKILFASLAIVGVLALLAGIRISRTITKPIAEIKEVSAAIAEGDFAIRTHINSKDEFGELAQDVNIMAEKLELYIERLNSEKAQLETIFQHLGAGVVVADTSGKILLINSKTENIFHASRDKIVGEQLYTLIRDDGFRENFYETIKRSNALDYEFKYQEKYFQAHFVPIVQNSLDVKIVILIYDISQSKHLQQMRSDFVSNASHELRTPLTAIRGYTETLLDGAMDDQDTTRAFLEIIDSESQRLTRIVEDLLDLGRLERNADFKKTMVPLKSLVVSVATRYTPVMLKKGLELIVDVPRDLMVYGDGDWLEIVFLNLVDNAVKYSKQGGKIYIEAKEEQSKVSVIVRDEGIGIPYNDLPRVFERFYRVDKSRSRSQGGTGLGLAIVKHIIESHQGSINVQSTLGEGTTIALILPKES